MLNHSPSQEDVFYRAYLNHDTTFEGIFFLAVKSTGVFCRPGCRARAPKRENVEFCSAAEDAIEQGYRPCKKCQPLQRQAERPAWVENALKLIDEQPDARISDAQLQQAGIDPVNLRRWFKRHHGMTFHDYQRRQRIAAAAASIDDGARVIDSALDAGFQSLSGFNQAFKNLVGKAPGSKTVHTAVNVATLSTPLGAMYAAATADALCLLEFTDRKALPRQIKRVQSHLNTFFVPGESELLGRVQTQLDEFFAGARTEFDIPLRLCGSEFQQQAWQALRAIPFAHTRTYQQQAQATGKPAAIRAIASANAANPIAIIVPCHRVIAKSGSLAGYAGGTWRKQHLINLEKNSLEADRSEGQ